MWNQGNGNGNGQGYYPQQGYGQQQDVYGRLDNSRDVGGARFPYIAAGTHKLVLVTLEEFGDANNPKVRALFKTLESRTQQPGGFCVKIWALVKPPRFQNGVTEADEFADFCRKLKGAPAGFPISNDIRVLMKERNAEQLARGTVIECTGVAGKPNAQNPNKEPYVRVYWNSLRQEPADIAAMRQRIEQEGVPSTASPQQQGGGQFQNAPHPSQIANQYPAQQGMPMQPGPQQGYQSPMPAQSPQQWPTPQQGQPGYPARQGYVQQPAQPQQGGQFLPQLPPNNGPQGGNGGRGW